MYDGSILLTPVHKEARDEWAYDLAQNRMELVRTAPYTIFNVTAYDEQSQRLMAFGLDNTAVYNMENKAWEKTEPEEEPGTWRFGFGLAYDSQSDRTILFGWGGDGDNLNDTWAYDYETNAWTAVESTGGPSYRGGHTMVYHPGTDRIILFGGYHLGEVGFSDETWAYDYNTNTWTPLTPASHPSGRRYLTMVYAETADKMVLSGGMAGNFLKEETSDELWILDPVSDEWSEVTPGSMNP